MPSDLRAFIAFRLLLPVLIKSSITTTLDFSSILPSIWFLRPCPFGSGLTYAYGTLSLSDIIAPTAIAPVATPAIDISLPYLFLIIWVILSAINSLIFGYERTNLLSQ